MTTLPTEPSNIEGTENIEGILAGNYFTNDDGSLGYYLEGVLVRDCGPEDLEQVRAGLLRAAEYLATVQARLSEDRAQRRG